MEELLINTLAEKEIVEESKNAVKTIADRFVKTKAYYNALAANAVENYLRAKGLVNGEIFNLHNSAKILADFEIADIQLPNLHIDVRAVFDENEIFIPKKHFTNHILPDIYLVMKLDENLHSGKLLGFVEPSKINKQNGNDEYYFVNKSFLTPALELEGLIKSTPVKSQYMITDATESSVEKLIMLYMDHDLDDSKLEKLLDYLKNSADAREKLVEFENFERLSYLALKEFKDLDIEKNDFTQYIKTLVTTDEFAEFEHTDELSLLFNNDATPTSGGLFVDDEVAVREETTAEPAVEEVYEEAEVFASEDEQEPETVETPEEEVQAIVAEPTVVEEEETPVAEEPVLPIDEFDAFDSVDEFESLETEEVAETAETPQVEDLAVEEQELALEPGDVLDVELPQEFAVQEDTVAPIGESVPEVSDDTITGEDLEFQVEGLAELSLEPLELDETPLEEIHTDIAEDIVIEPEEPAAEPDVELNVEKTLDMDDVNLDSETVIGLTEGVMVEEVDPVVESAPETSDEVPGFDFAALEGLDLDSAEEKPVEEETPLVSGVQTVTDEEVDKAIALSQAEEPLQDVSDEFSHDEASENSEFSLDELLSMENDLSGGAPTGFKFDDETEEEEEAEPKVTEAPSEEDLAILTAELDEDTEVSVDDNAAEAQEHYNFEENQEIPEDGTDFAFAVDQKPAQRNILMPIAALITVVGLIGAGAWYFLFNGKNSNNEITIVDDNKNTVEDINLGTAEPATAANSVNDITADIQIPAETTAPKELPQADGKVPAAKKPENKATEAATPQPEPLTIQKIKKDFSQPNTYLSVSKIVWDVPEYLTYNEDFSGYLQTLGSTLKLNLSGDLLLISENTLLNRVKVKVGLKDSGRKFSAELIDGCGTKSVDDLVLQSVKNTLNLLKPPVNSLDTADEDLYITIYL